MEGKAVWVSLREWAKLHGVTPVTAVKLIEGGKIDSGSYIHEGRLWRIDPQAPIINKVAIKIPPCKNFLKELEAI